MPDSTEPPGFLADAMLGRLARWLRVLGADAAYDAASPDATLVRRARTESRVLLTRDRALVADLRPPRVVLVTSDEPLAQLRQVVMETRLAPPRQLFTRCLVCNEPLRDLHPLDAAALVPERARGLPGPVRRCPRCERVYWPGSHARRMRAALGRALPGWLDEK
jgi:uncharacterized protein